MSTRAIPMWQLVRQCAQALTEAGHVPFTRGDLIECVKKHNPEAKPGSINPVIQGITDNLKGGAPGAVSKKILHSVGRGRFMLRGAAGAGQVGPFRTKGTAKANTPRRSTPSPGTQAMPETEADLRDAILELLRPRLRDIGCDVVIEGTVTYQLPDGTTLRHASDILVSKPDPRRHVSIELKYKSAVTDQFKCRAYDAAHMKAEHGDAILTIMAPTQHRYQESHNGPTGALRGC